MRRVSITAYHALAAFVNIGSLCISLILEVRVYETLKLGEHYIVDLSACNRKLLMDSEKLHTLFSKAVRDSGLTVVEEGLYKFSPHGFTSFLLLAESHASLHAWPEYGYCAIDLFTCAIGKDLMPLIDHIKDAFGAESCTVHKLERSALLVPAQHSSIA